MFFFFFVRKKTFLSHKGGVVVVLVGAVAACIFFLFLYEYLSLKDAGSGLYLPVYSPVQTDMANNRRKFSHRTIYFFKPRSLSFAVSSTSSFLQTAKRR